MDSGVGTELRALLRVIVDLRVPEEGDSDLKTNRPECLNILELGWLEDLVKAVVEGVLVTFDLRKKTDDDDLEEIEEWKKPVVANGWTERRKNHRLRIRTMVDDLFEEKLPLSEVPASVRAWKLRVADECANVILDRFHVRSASSGPWASYRKKMHRIGESLQQALGYKDLFLMTGRTAEAKAMGEIVETAHRAMDELMHDLQDSDLAAKSK